MTFSRVLILTAGLLFANAPSTFVGAQPAAAPPSPTLQSPAAGNVERGRYLVERVAMCAECHSGRDTAGAIVPSERYLGSPLPFRPQAGWADRAPRIAGLPGYSDAQAMDLLTQGAIGRHGAVLRAPMPRYHMTESDARDVVAFLRSLP